MRRGLDPENVKQVLASLGRASELLGKTAWHQEGLQALHGALSASRDQLETLRDGIAQAEIGAGKAVAEPSLTTAVLRDLEALKGLVERKMDGVVAMAMTNPCHGAPCWKAICNGPASARASWRPCPRRNLTRPLARRLRKFREL